MKSPEELEWERATRAGASVRRGKLMRLGVALLVAAACATATFIGAVHFWDSNHQADADLQADGIYVPKRSGKSEATSAVLLFVGLPALIGTVAFFGVFLMVGGRVPDQIRSALDARR